MDADIAYFVTYPCPGCRLELEAHHDGWRGWLRCPSCGTPSLPPEILLGHPSTRRRVRDFSAPGEEVVIIADENDARPDRTPLDPAALIDAPQSPVIGTVRLVLFAALVISLFLLLVAYLDDNQQVTSATATLSLIFFLLLLRTPGRRRRRP